MDENNLGPVAADMKARLERALHPTTLSITDDSAAHHGHAGHDGRGESHFTVAIASATLAGLSRVAQQRLVYNALGDLMTTRVHALIIKVFT